MLQLFAHPVYEAVEGSLKRQLRIEREAAETAVRIIVRVVYCGICAGLAMLLPFFNGELKSYLEQYVQCHISYVMMPAHCILGQAGP